MNFKEFMKDEAEFRAEEECEYVYDAFLVNNKPGAFPSKHGVTSHSITIGDIAARKFEQRYLDMLPKDSSGAYIAKHCKIRIHRRSKGSEVEFFGK